MELIQPPIDAAREFANTVIAALRDERGVHAETAVAGVVLNSRAAFNLAVYGFIEGTKAAPDPVIPLS